eukprot:365043-Chlamydomonas_euryale.AAC.27
MRRCSSPLTIAHATRERTECPPGTAVPPHATAQPHVIDAQKAECRFFSRGTLSCPRLVARSVRPSSGTVGQRYHRPNFHTMAPPLGLPFTGLHLAAQPGYIYSTPHVQKKVLATELFGPKRAQVARPVPPYRHTRPPTRTHAGHVGHRAARPQAPPPAGGDRRAAPRLRRQLECGHAACQARRAH